MSLAKSQPSLASSATNDLPGRAKTRMGSSCSRFTSALGGADTTERIQATCAVSDTPRARPKATA